HYQLTASETLFGRVLLLEKMASSTQTLADILRNIAFQSKQAILQYPKPRCIESCLWIHIKVHQIANYLNVSLCLHQPTHQPKTGPRPPVAHDHSGDNCMER